MTLPTPPAAAAGSAPNELGQRFCIATLTFQRARQLHAGARARVDPGGHKLLRVAFLEVSAGTISWDVAPKAP